MANAQGVAGFTAFYCGGARQPWRVVGVRSATGWDTLPTSTSTLSRPDQAWGDHLYCTPRNANTAQWVTSGDAPQGGSARRNIEPRFVRFHM